LFREFLLRRAAEVLPHEERIHLRHKAAVLLEEMGELEAAVSLYQSAGAWGELAALIYAQASHLIENGREAMLERWIRDLPDGVVARRGCGGGALAGLLAWRLSAAPRPDTGPSALRGQLSWTRDSGRSRGLVASVGGCCGRDYSGRPRHESARLLDPANDRVGGRRPRVPLLGCRSAGHHRDDGGVVASATGPSGDCAVGRARVQHAR
jgi:hypothetical protein